MYLYIRSEMEKWGASLFLKQKYVPPPLTQQILLYYRRVLSIYTIYVSGKLGRGGLSGEDEWSDSSVEKIYSDDL